jgi:IS1 family transposase
MNILPRDKQIAIIAALSEGTSIRSVERLTGVHRDTIGRLALRIGRGCAGLHDDMMQDLPVSLIELDEMWSFVGKKQRRVTFADPLDFGDQYVFLALGATNKAILSYHVGRRDYENTEIFARDLRARILGVPQINSDGFRSYEGVIREVFGEGVNYAQITKTVRGESSHIAARRYSPGDLVAVAKRVVIGKPNGALISTSYVERQNLNVRMVSRRFTRLTNAFSKKLANHEAAVALFVAVHNFVRVHGTTRETPAMTLGLTKQPWSIGDLIDAAEAAGRSEPMAPAPIAPPPPPPAPVRERPRFTVIQGGRA